MEGSSWGGHEESEVSKKEELVCSKWRWLIRGTKEDSDDSGGYCVRLFTVLAHQSYPGIKGHKMVVSKEGTIRLADVSTQETERYGKHKKSQPQLNSSTYFPESSGSARSMRSFRYFSSLGTWMCLFVEHAFTSRNNARHWPLADARSSFPVMPDMSGSSTRMPYARSTFDLHSVQNLHITTYTTAAQQLDVFIV